MNCIALLCFITTCFEIIDAGKKHSNYSQMPNDVVRTIIGYVPPVSLDNYRATSRKHYESIEEYYQCDISKLLDLIFKSVFRNNTNVIPQIHSVMLRHQNDNTFYQLYNNFPFIPQDIKQIPYYMKINSFLYKELHKLNISNSTLIPDPTNSLWNKRYLEIQNTISDIQYLSQTLESQPAWINLIRKLQPYDALCSAWSECFINVLHANKNISLSFNDESFFQWLEIVIQIAYYHYQRQDTNHTILYKQVINSLTNTFYDDQHGKRLLYYLKQCHHKGYCTNYYTWTYIKVIPALKDTYFIYVMMRDVRQQRDDWDIYNVSDMIDISYFAKIWFSIAVLINISVAYIIAMIIMRWYWSLIENGWAQYEHFTGKGCGQFVLWMVKLIIRGIVIGGIYYIVMHFIILLWLTTFCLRRLKKWSCCTICFKNSKIFKITVVCLCPIFAVIVLVPLFVIPPF
eukprot:83948_1